MKMYLVCLNLKMIDRLDCSDIFDNNERLSIIYFGLWEGMRTLSMILKYNINILFHAAEISFNFYSWTQVATILHLSQSMTKPTKWKCVPSEDSDKPGHLPTWSVFDVHLIGS